jgi:hypothetical protein
LSNLEQITCFHSLLKNQSASGRPSASRGAYQIDEIEAMGNLCLEVQTGSSGKNPTTACPQSEGSRRTGLEVNSGLEKGQRGVISVAVLRGCCCLLPQSPYISYSEVLGVDSIPPAWGLALSRIRLSAGKNGKTVSLITEEFWEFCENLFSLGFS